MVAEETGTRTTFDPFCNTISIETTMEWKCDKEKKKRQNIVSKQFTFKSLNLYCEEHTV